MTDIAANPNLLNDVTVKIGENTYQEALKTVRLVPTTPVVKWKGLGGNTHVLAGTPEWDVNFAFAQDIDSAASLHKLLLETAPGTVLPFEFTPKADGGKTVALDLTVIPADIGGDLDTVPEASVTLGGNGQPVFS